MEPISIDNIKSTITSMVKSFDDELFSLTEEQLKNDRWYWEWDDEHSVVYNTYKFFDMLKTYSSSCRRWEDHHAGHFCIVERVRDKYLLPKIGEFVNILKEKTV